MPEKKPELKRKEQGLSTASLVNLPLHHPIVDYYYKGRGSKLSRNERLEIKLNAIEDFLAIDGSGHNLMLSKLGAQSIKDTLKHFDEHKEEDFRTRVTKLRKKIDEMGLNLNK